MNEFNRRALNAETRARISKERELIKISNSEVSSSIDHLHLSLEKFLERLDSDLVQKHKEHVDNVYYHIGNIKGYL